MRLLVFAILFLLVGCATASGVIETGPDSYIISKDAGAFGGLGNMKTESIQEASQYCKANGKALKVTGTEERPPGIFGKYAHADIQFMCLNAGDSRLGGTLVPITASPVDKVMNKKTEKDD